MRTGIEKSFIQINQILINRFLSTVIIVLSSLILIPELYGQEEAIKHVGFHISVGTMIPVGSYASKSAVESALLTGEHLYDWYDDKFEYYNFKGFSQEVSGFAKAGAYLDMNLQIWIRPQWFLQINLGWIKHTHETSQLEDYYSYMEYNYPVSVAYSQTQLFFAGPGAGYSFRRDRLEIESGISSGWSSTNYPLYFAVYEEKGWELGHRGETPDLSSFYIKPEVRFSYLVTPGFQVGLDLGYFWSDFKYEMKNDYWMGTDLIVVEGDLYEDRLNVKMMNAGLFLRFKL